MKQSIFILLFFISLNACFAQSIPADSASKNTIQDSVLKDSTVAAQAVKDTFIVKTNAYQNLWDSALANQPFLNSKGTPVSLVVIKHKGASQAPLFYLLAALAALLGFFRFFYVRYFNNLFRVFFNTSLRQSQLTDQLLQAKLPSLLFNFFFALTGGIFLALMLLQFNKIEAANLWNVIGVSIVAVGVLYFVKFLVLKFTGWVTGYGTATDTYIFVIFLVNKILAILLLPIIMVLAFSIPLLKESAAWIALILIGLMFLLRFFRSYGLLQNAVKVSRLHFFMYIAGIEILPLLLLYKGLILLLNKNL
ncbi:MAG: DUF4271 domain-containing protein [Ferruginibacter sp.]